MPTKRYRNWEVVSIAPDLIVLRGRCSTYGGGHDPGDNSIGAWGFNSAEHPDAPGYSLPIPIITRFLLNGNVRVTVENAHGKKVRGFLADKGPSAALGRVVDILPRPFALLGLETDNVVTVYVKPREVVPPLERTARAELVIDTAT